MAAPTADDLAALAAIEGYCESHHGAGPTARQLAELMGLSAHTAAWEHVLRLEEHELVACERVGVKRQMAPRSLHVTEAGQCALRRLKQRATSTLFVGAKQLRLTQDELLAAKRIELPLGAFRSERLGDIYFVSFAGHAERDFWGNRILDALEEHGRD